VRTAGPRIELIRFALLIVLTIALVSVAVRINSSNTSHSSAVRPPVSGQPTTSVPSSGQPTSAPASTPASTPASASASTPAKHHHPTPTGSVPSTGPSTGPRMLPVTGSDSAIRLAGLAVVLLVAGAGAISASRRPSR